MRYRLRTLLIVLAWTGLACRAVRTPTAFWSWAVFISAAIALLTSALVIVYRRGESRAFAVGFLLFGGSIFVLMLLPTSGRLSPTSGMNEIASLLFRQFHAQATDLNRLLGLEAIVQSAFVILLGGLGGVIAQILYAKRREDD